MAPSTSDCATTALPSLRSVLDDELLGGAAPTSTFSPTSLAALDLAYEVAVAYSDADDGFVDAGSLAASVRTSVEAAVAKSVPRSPPSRSTRDASLCELKYALASRCSIATEAASCFSWALRVLREVAGSHLHP